MRKLLGFFPEGVEGGANRSPQFVSLSLACLVTVVGCSGEPGRVSPTQAPIPADERVEPLPDPADSDGFTDVTVAAGIRAVHQPPTPDLTNIVDAVGTGAAFGDLDGDGWLDLVVGAGAPSPDPASPREQDLRVRIYRNLRDGRFTDVTEGSGIPADATAVAVAVGDVDGDGLRDLFFATRGQNRLFRNAGDGSFKETTGKSGVGDRDFGVGAAFLDIEGDGDLDLYVTNYLDYDPREQNYYGPDGYPGPLAYPAQQDRLYRNRGDGTFEDVSSESGIDAVVGRGMSVAVADFDADGDTDIFVANDATANFLFLNDGKGRFEEVGLYAGVAMGENGEQTSAMAADVGDIDGDGLVDIAVSDTAYGAVYRQVRQGFFVDEVMRSGVGMLCGQYVGWGQNLIDFDNDGRLDLFVVNGGLHHLIGWEDLLLQNAGNFRFEDASDLGGTYFSERRVGRGSIAGDYDNDGDDDLFVTHLDGAHRLLRNDIAGGEGWITLDLVGTRSRDPFGARVELQHGDRVAVVEVRARNGYLGQGDPRPHLGLGTDVAALDSVRVRWPGGDVTEITGVPTGQIVRIEETQ